MPVQPATTTSAKGGQEYIPVSEFIRRAKERGVNFGFGDPYNRLRYYTKIGLLPHMTRRAVEWNEATVGHYPESALDTLEKIEDLKKRNLSNIEIEEKLEKERIEVLLEKTPLDKLEARAPQISTRISFAWVGAFVLALVLLGTTALAGLSPLHRTRLARTVRDFKENAITNLVAIVLPQLADQINGKIPEIIDVNDILSYDKDGNLVVLSHKISVPVLRSTVKKGQAPLEVASDTKVKDLNADLLDGHDTGTGPGNIPFLDEAANLVLETASGVFDSLQALGRNIFGPSKFKGDVDVEGDMDVNQKLTVSGNAVVSSTLAIGSAGTQTYNLIADTVASASGAMDSDLDLYIQEDLEVDGTAYLSGLASSGNLTISNANPTLTFEDTTAGDDGWNINVDGDSFYIYNVNDTTNYLTIDGGGSVGIGTINPSTTLHISATDGLVIPVGTTAQRPGSLVSGIIRYNTNTSQFEGYGSSNWGSLGGVIDVDQDTYISAETSPGADNDELRFFTAGTERMRIDSSGSVGIGTTAPTAGFELDVVGAGRFSNGLTVAAGTVSLPAGEIGNTELANSSVSYGGISVSLGGSDATPAFDLSDATSLPIVVGTTGTLTIARGGTGATTLTDHGVLVGSGTGAITPLAVGTDGQVLIGSTGNDPSWGTIGAASVTDDSLDFSEFVDAMTLDALTKVDLNSFDFGFYGAGNVGIGTTSPVAPLSVGASSQFQVSSTGNVTGGTYNKVTLTAPASGSTLTIADGKTLIVSHSLTLAGSDATTLTFQGTDTYVGRATTDSLTNKTLTDSSNVLGGVTMTLGSDATGDIYYLTGGVLTRLGIGTATQVLHGGTTPSYSAIAAADITDDSLDFSEFVDAMTLDASTKVDLNSQNFSFWNTGNVGIGTTGPTSKLSVAGGVGIGTTAPGSVYHSTATAPDGGLIVETSIGVGTTGPTYTMEVIGDGRFSTNLTVSGGTLSVPSATTIDLATADVGSTINIATEATTADSISIGNSHTDSTLALTGGDDWSMAATGFLTMSASAAQTTAILIADTDYTNALSIGDNKIVGTTAAIDFDNFDLATTGHMTVQPAYGLDVNAGGELKLGDTTATTVSIGTTAATALNIGDAALTTTIDIGGVTADGTTTINIATNNTSADVVTIGSTHASSTLALNSGDWTISTTGVMAGIGNITTDGNITMSTDDAWIGVDASNERIIFDQDGDDIELLVGNVGIGSTAPSALFSVGAANQFTINSSGAITAATGITSSGDITLSGVGAGTDDSVIVVDGSGKLYHDEIDTRVWGSSLADFTGTPANNQLAIWTDTDTLEGDSTFTWDGTNFDIGADDKLLRFGTSQDYSIQWDGDDAVHTIGAGDFVFTGGNVGIGTTSPDTKLHIYGVLTMQRGGATTWITNSHDPKIYGGDDPGAGSYPFNFAGHLILQPRSSAGGHIVLATGSTTPSVRMVITNAGNVGIGTTGPAAKLEVAGDIHQSASAYNTYGATAGSSGYGIHDNAGTMQRKNSGGAWEDIASTAAEAGGWTDDGTVVRLTTGTDKVGIGTTGPFSILHLENPAGGSPYLGITYSIADGTKTNWFTGAQYNVNNAFEITPSTAAGGTTFSTPAITILSTGNVGIGTTGPGQRLNIKSAGTGGTEDILFVQDAHATYLSTGVKLGITGHEGEIKILDEQGRTQVYLSAYYDSYINPFAGNVGIGTTSPVALLHVSDGSASSITGGADDIVITDVANPRLVFEDTGEGSDDKVIVLAYYDENLHIGSMIDTMGSWVKPSIAVFNRDGNVGIGNTGPDYLLEMEASGGGYYDESAHDWVDTSSIRWKENIQEIESPLEKIAQLRGINFNWKSDYGGAADLGFIAEEVGLVLPDIVSWDKDGSGYARGLNYGKLTALLVEGVKEQQGEIEEMRGELAGVIGVIGPMGEILEEHEERITKLEENDQLSTLNSTINNQPLNDQVPNEEEATESASVAEPDEPEPSSNLDDEPELGSYGELRIKKSLEVLGSTSLFDLTVAGQAMFGANLVIGDLGESIDTIASPLKLQSKGRWELEMMAGKVVVDTEGNLHLKEGVLYANDQMRDATTVSAGMPATTIARNWSTNGGPPVSVTVTPSWNTTTWVVDLTEKGFTIHFGTPPTESEKVYWFAVW